MLSGDVHINPGPKTNRTPKHPCTICHKEFSQTVKSIECDVSSGHITCANGISIEQYNNAVENDLDLNYVC